jgi:hypothetical protein
MEPRFPQYVQLVGQDTGHEVYEMADGEETLNEDWEDRDTQPPGTYVWRDVKGLTTFTGHGPIPTRRKVLEHAMGPWVAVLSMFARPPIQPAQPFSPVQEKVIQLNQEESESEEESSSWPDLPVSDSESDSGEPKLTGWATQMMGG